MDIITHALSGAAFTYTLPQKFRQWWFPIWGIFVSIAPDFDLLFITSTVDYFTIHRSITHSFAGAWGLSFLCAIPLFILTTFQPHTLKFIQSQQTPWSLIGAWFFSYIIILQHIWLDVMNSYGTQILLPFSEYKAHLDSLFIFDLILLIPLLLSIIFWRKNRSIMFLVLSWTIIYPIFTVGLKFGLETYLQRNYDAYPIHQVDSKLSKKTLNNVKVYLLPEAFTPFYWKIILDYDDYWNISGYMAFTKPPKKFLQVKKPSSNLLITLKKHSPLFSAYENFSTFLALSNTIQISQGTKYTFTDLRFVSTIPFINKIQRRNNNNEDTPFQFIAITDDMNIPLSIRFTGIGTGDTGWVSPLYQ